MKKIICLVLALLILNNALVFSAAEENEISVFINGEKLQFDVAPITVNDRTMVPMRLIFEKLGANVIWNEETSTVFAYNDSASVLVTIDSPYMETSSGIIKLDAPAMLKDDRTLIPLRAVAESFNCDVEWIEETKTVNIIYGAFVDLDKATPERETIEVSTADELLNSIGSNREIILTSDYYNLSKVSGIDNKNVEKSEYSDGFTIKDIVNLVIKGDAEIAIDDLYANVLNFERCGKIVLSGLTVGHTEPAEEYRCEGAVTRFYDCADIMIENCNLYGCGAVGVSAGNTVDIKIDKSKIYDCSYTGIWLTDGSEATVYGTTFCDSTHLSGFVRVDSSKLDCTNCEIYNIKCESYKYQHDFVDTLDGLTPSEITFTDCEFKNNTFSKITNEFTSNLTFKHCIFTDNNGSLEGTNAVFID